MELLGLLPHKSRWIQPQQSETDLVVVVQTGLQYLPRVEFDICHCLPACDQHTLALGPGYGPVE